LLFNTQSKKMSGPDPGDFHPTNRIGFNANALGWLKAKAVDDECEGLWRIHDDLYDLTGFENSHPGGKDWILLTKGTDITESFETSHVFGVPRALLKKFWVKKAEKPRTARFTFDEDGFYKKVQRRGAAILRKVGTGPTFFSTLTIDLLVITYLVLFCLLCAYPSMSLALTAAVFLGMAHVSAHNWFHQGDKTSWRRFYFDLSFTSSRDWRVSHAMSHHNYTNTFLDMEVSAFEPYGFSFLPVTKTGFMRVFQHLYAHIACIIVYPIEFVKRIYLILSEDHTLLPENLLAPLQLLLLYLFTQDLVLSTQMWVTIHAVCGYMLVIQFSWTHHHPELYHAGDKPREDRDWGLHIMDTTMDFDRTEDTWGVLSTPLQLVTFGHHLLHHYFPTVDTSKLEYLYPALYETCDEMGEVYPFRSVPHLIHGLHRQLNRSKPTHTREEGRQAG